MKVNLTQFAAFQCELGLKSRLSCRAVVTVPLGQTATEICLNDYKMVYGHQQLFTAGFKQP